jgi:hypothetical protein
LQLEVCLALWHHRHPLISGTWNFVIVKIIKYFIYNTMAGAIDRITNLNIEHTPQHHLITPPGLVAAIDG